jgi:putative Mn2+ efflux pump MntP
MNDYMTRYGDTQAVVFGIFVILVLLLGVYIGWNLGHERGVKDHAAGKFVMVTLPNGDTVVCDVREAR